MEYNPNNPHDNYFGRIIAEKIGKSVEDLTIDDCSKIIDEAEAKTPEMQQWMKEREEMLHIIENWHR